MVRVCLKPAWRELIQEVEKDADHSVEFEMRFTPAIEFLISTTQTSLSWFHPLTGGKVLATTIIIIFLQEAFVQHLDHCIFNYFTCSRKIQD